MVSPFTSKIKSVSLVFVMSVFSSIVCAVEDLRGERCQLTRIFRSLSRKKKTQLSQVAAVEELLREGRAALHTSIASYKFLITYGLLFSVLKLACYYYGVIMCQVRGWSGGG